MFIELVTTYFGIWSRKSGTQINCDVERKLITQFEVLSWVAVFVIFRRIFNFNITVGVGFFAFILLVFDNFFIFLPLLWAFLLWIRRGERLMGRGRGVAICSNWKLKYRTRYPPWWPFKGSSSFFLKPFNFGVHYSFRNHTIPLHSVIVLVLLF